MAPELFSTTTISDAAPDLLAKVAAHQGEPIFYIERRGLAIAAVGSAAEIVTSGPCRFAEASREALRVLSSIRSVGDIEADRLVVGGFAFSDQNRVSTDWREFPALRLLVPRLLWIWEPGRCRVTKIWAAGSPESDDKHRSPASAAVVGANVPPERSVDPCEAELWRRRVDCVRSLIAAGTLDKVVIARRVELSAPTRIDPGAVAAAARAARPSCFTFWLSGGATSFVGSTPELLVKLEGDSVRSGALAGSAPRGTTSERDRLLGEALLASVKNRSEHQFVVSAICSALAEVADSIIAPPVPELILLPEAQHLFTSVAGRLRQPCSALELAGLLHPTPAVCGLPLERARAIIEREEPERGWYSGGVGWMNARGDGEFAVALRCALIEGHQAVAWAGAGIVSGSDSDAEFAETESKLTALFGSHNLEPAL